ncbi:MULTISPECIES: recombinase family protein [Sphingobium]|uniref:recombinase family protein n=1 Tax=Sphingobium TaxID=165695 RepID=UPI0015EB48EF|nr:MULTISPECIES: recombinase family protein [Sphingobium]MCW2363866.1 DNA invertase Pin-like site-specific DNA recombinase [Sphingobium sp. B10D3B]MCW2402737.1 DNA invertase Pin-like site-specific DNA recombinase [Sphingobium sp. B10D7B]MCW2409716.1 DNA invertase Pin-like site-specific DNA recombinase [Sphingobium xanthum]
MERFVVYCRVSTGKQEASGLGLEAQREAVERYVQRVGGDIVGEFVETISGTKANRPELARALALCRREKATILIARLDRLSRSLSFVAQLLDANVEIRCADMPEANRLLLQMLAVFSEHERQMIRDRTKAALAAAKARGVLLGANGRVLAEKNRLEARAHAIGLRSAFADAQEAGCRTLSQIAAFLTAQGYATATGGKWHAMTVRRILARLEQTSA